MNFYLSFLAIKLRNDSKKYDILRYCSILNSVTNILNITKLSTVPYKYYTYNGKNTIIAILINILYSFGNKTERGYEKLYNKNIRYQIRAGCQENASAGRRDK